MGLILSSTNNYIAKITLNRPEAANAFSKQMLEEIIQQLENWKNDPSIRVLLITGAGEKVFSAGADLKERRGMNETEVREAVKLIREMIQSVYHFPKPVIAAINGAAIGGGLELALACDLRIASENANFALTETGLGIIPGGGGTQTLPRLIGVHKAKEMIYTGRSLTATEALQAGLLLKVTYRKELLDSGMDLAYDISQRAPIAISQAKWAINKGIETEIDQGMQLEAKAYEKVIPTKDRLEGLAAFKEKRAPEFKGE
jgi:methylglutaconyl-CoA hydratase